MAYEVSMRVDLRQLEALSERWEQLRVVMAKDGGRAETVATKAAGMLVGAVREEIVATAVASRFFSVRTGNLARSYREQVSIDRKGIRIGAVSDSVYARIQDKGGRIFPKTVKRLAIPLKSMAAGKWPRHWPRGELFRRGKALSRRVGKTKIENVYALAKSVRLEPKNYTKRAAERVSDEVASYIVQELILKGLEGGK